MAEKSSVVFTFQHSHKSRTARIFWIWTVAGALAAVSRSWTSLAILLATVFWTFPRRRISEESVMAVRDVGLQLTTRFSDGSENHFFIPTGSIADIVVNEAPAGFVIRTYLVVVAKEATKNYLPFEHTELPLKTLAQVLFGLRAVLINESVD